MAGTAGKISLVSTPTGLAGACPTGSVDFVGYDSTANCAEGMAPTVTLSNTTAALRAAGGCADSNTNGPDFTAAAPTPRSSAAAVSMCSVSSLPVLSVEDPSIIEGDSGQSYLYATFTLSSPAGPGGVTFRTSTADGTATASQESTWVQ